MTRRLYLQIYLGFLAISLLVALVGGMLAWRMRFDAAKLPPALAAAIEMFGAALPGPERPAQELQVRLEEQSRKFGLHATVWSGSGQSLAIVGRPLPAPPFDEVGPVVLHVRGGPPGIAVRLKDGRWLGLSLDPRAMPHDHRWGLGLALLAGVIALGAYPISRRIAGRLERLQGGVDRLGAGQLSARVAVEGRDEVADLARSFNRAADRIEALVSSQRRLLASASHELRSPLTRLRLAVELMDTQTRPELRDEVERDIAELDVLIEDLLLAARLDSRAQPLKLDTVELLTLAREEGAHFDARVTGEPVQVSGDARLLRRLLRNLLENARRYGAGSEIEVSVTPLDTGGARLCVSDGGPGVPESERERIFEAFYRREGHSEGRDGGVGLGLALVREIAQQHGGSARCLPRPGGGSRFEVDLPTGPP